MIETLEGEFRFSQLYVFRKYNPFLWSFFCFLLLSLLCVNVNHFILIVENVSMNSKQSDNNLIIPEKNDIKEEEKRIENHIPKVTNCGVSSYSTKVFLYDFGKERVDDKQCYKDSSTIEIEMVPFYPKEVDNSMEDNPWNCDSGYLALPFGMYNSYL